MDLYRRDFVGRESVGLDLVHNVKRRTQKGSQSDLAGNTVCIYPRDLGSRPGGGEIHRKVEVMETHRICVHMFPRSVPTRSRTLSGPVSAWSSVPLRIRTWRWNVVRVITFMYPPSVITPFLKYGNCFGKWAQA